MGRFQIWQKRRAEAVKNPPTRKKEVTITKKDIRQSPPVTLGDLVSEDKLLWLYCCDCGRERNVNPTAIPLPPETPVPDVRKRMKCSACGSRKINTKPELPGFRASR